MEAKIEIIARKKQIDANSEIYYAIYLSKHKISTTSNKIKNILI